MSRIRRRAAAMAIAGAVAVAPLVSACGAGQHPQSVLPTRLTEGVNASVGHIDVRNAFVLGPEPGQQLPQDGSAAFYVWIIDKTSPGDRLVGVEAPGWARSVQIAGGGLALPPNQLVSTNPLKGAPQASGAPTPGTTAGSPATGASPSSGTPSKAPAKKPGKRTTPGKPAKPGTPTGTPGAASPPPGVPSNPATTTTPGAASPGGTAAGPVPLVVLQGLSRPLKSGETIPLTLHFQQAGSLSLNVPVVPRAGYYATYPPAPSSGAPSTPSTPTPSAPSPGTTPGAATPAPGASGSPTAGAAKPAKHAKARKPAAKPTA